MRTMKFLHMSIPLIVLWIEGYLLSVFPYAIETAFPGMPLLLTFLYILYIAIVISAAKVDQLNIKIRENNDSTR